LQQSTSRAWLASAAGPWSRTVHAELAQRLNEAGARVIAFDIFFPERESQKADTQLARVLAGTKKAVLSTVFLMNSRDARFWAMPACRPG
jgi:CHASE2 domain-containing sensor protein